MEKTFLKKMVMAAGFLVLTACHSEPKTPMEAVMSNELSDKYSATFYQELYEKDRPQYKQILKYCEDNKAKPNCQNVMVADGRIFNGIKPDGSISMG